MLHGKASLLLPALILYAVATEAATREEVERFTATQLPGSVQVCRGEGILKAGEHRMTFTSYVRGTVVSRRDGRQHMKVETTNAADGVIYTRYTYELDSWLEESAEVSVVVPESIRVSVPSDKAEADAVAQVLLSGGVQRLPFRDVDASRFPEWDISPQPDDPMDMRFHCGPGDSVG
ncbi:hypothetical protein [Pantoea eucalypti]|uniref:hypothetical protein n=1 Tax=Pantoea eucalypti TaxID=470933 RepID=UPI003D7EA44D